MIHWCLAHPWIGLVAMAVIGIVQGWYEMRSNREKLW